MYTLNFIRKKSSSFPNKKWSMIAGGATVLISGALAIVSSWKRKSTNGDTNHEEQAESLESMTKEELYEKARDEDIEGRSTMNKDELIEALQ